VVAVLLLSAVVPSADLAAGQSLLLRRIPDSLLRRSAVALCAGAGVISTFPGAIDHDGIPRFARPLARHLNQVNVQICCRGRSGAATIPIGILKREESAVTVRTKRGHRDLALTDPTRCASILGSWRSAQPRFAGAAIAWWPSADSRGGSRKGLLQAR